MERTYWEMTKMDQNIKKIRRMTSITEYKTNEEFLEKQAMEGWLLYEIKKGAYKFKKIEPKELTFNVSLFYHTTPFDYPDNEKEKDYRVLCEESGWKFCTSNELYQIFYRHKDTEAIPIHTDAQEEYKIIKNVFMKTEFISMISLFFLGIIGIVNWRGFNYEYLLSNSMLFSLISPIFIFIIVGTIHIPTILWLVRNKKNVKNGKELIFITNRRRVIHSRILWSLIGIYFVLLICSLINTITSSSIGVIIVIALFPMFIAFGIAKIYKKRVRTKKNTRKNNIIFFVVMIIVTIIAVEGILMMMLGVFAGESFMKTTDKVEKLAALQLSDFGTMDKPERSRVHKQSSIFVPISFMYYETIGRKAEENEIYSVRTEYMECRNEKVAAYIFDQYMKKQKDRQIEEIEEYRSYGDEKIAKEKEERIKKEISSISNELWNIDKGYYLTLNKSKVIILDDNKIYILRSDVDFSEKEIIQICKKKLEIH